MKWLLLSHKRVSFWPFGHRYDHQYKILTTNY
uniref:Uncharacterized protein n=1 Tax=Arundo donax TaxID=35708 RepID=A0A0A9ABB8_ARUDO